MNKKLSKQMQVINLLKYLNNYLDAMRQSDFFFLVLGLSFGLGVFDYLIGPELSFSVLYTMPVMLAVWYGGKSVGITVAVFSVGIWLGVDLAAGNDFSSFLIPILNTLVRLAFFLVILWLLLIIREKLKLEESLADTDPLTGLANRRFFQEQLEREYVRVHRYPEALTIAYLDLDNFKYVNDSMGHETGDELLIMVSQTLSSNIRSSDFSARLGGDEFAVMLPKLEYEAAIPLIKKLQNELLSVMQANNWPVTFSIGAVSYSEVMESSRDMIKQVDNLMYEVKKSGKNNIKHIVWPERSS